MAGCETPSAGVDDLELIIKDNLDDTTLIPCSICRRTFKSESLRKHQGVCQKNATKKRRVFDSMKQRIQGTELAEYIPIPVIPPKPKLIAINKVVTDKSVKDCHSQAELPRVGNDVNPASISEKPHASVRSRSLVSQGPSRGGGAFKEERCPHCDRTFSWKAFSRHEEWCREHKSRTAQAQSPAAVLKAKEMLDARIKYRAPVLGKSKRPTNREKYAGGVHVSSALDSSNLSMEDNPRSSHNTPKTPAASSSIGNKKKVVASKVSTVNLPAVRGAPDRQVPSSTGQSTRRGLLPSKKISSVLQSPSSRENGNNGIDNEQPLAKHSPYQSIYDPFCKAEMQLKELLSDGGGINKPMIEPLPSPEVHSSENGAYVYPDYVSAKKNENMREILEIHSNQKQAKEVELPDVFTETSTQLSFEMPNLIRGRDGFSNTKRRSMKPTAQNMGIELNPVKARDESVGRRDSQTSKISGPNTINCDNQNHEDISSIMDMGFIITPNRNTKLNPSQELDVDNIHESINLVALGLTNLSTNSSESLVDMDNNNGSLEMKMRAEVETTAVNSSRDLSELEGRNWTAIGPNILHQGSSGDSDEGGKRVRRRKRRGKGPGGDCEGSSSPESLVAIHPLVSGKPLVDSAYSSLSRPTLHNIKGHKGAANKAFDLFIHPTSSDGEHDNDRADDWLEDDLVSKKTLRQEKWSAGQEEIDEPLNDFKLAKFCHDCGSRYPLTEAKFCCVCGARRLAV